VIAEVARSFRSCSLSAPPSRTWCTSWALFRMRAFRRRMKGVSSSQLYHRSVHTYPRGDRSEISNDPKVCEQCEGKRTVFRAIIRTMYPYIRTVEKISYLRRKPLADPDTNALDRREDKLPVRSVLESLRNLNHLSPPSCWLVPGMPGHRINSHRVRLLSIA
jgi:hypothetical protein